MTQLLRPAADLRDSLVATVADFDSPAAMHGSGFWHFDQGFGLADLSSDRIGSIVAHLTSYADPATVLPESMVHCDFLWIADEREVIGFLGLRHQLNDFLLNEGGHIGYSVRPSRRREGHASRALALSLERAAALGIERALVTCDLDNEPSRRTIEHNGGVLEDERNGKLRFWVDTPGSVS